MPRELESQTWTTVLHAHQTHPLSQVVLTLSNSDRGLMRQNYLE